MGSGVIEEARLRSGSGLGEGPAAAGELAVNQRTCFAVLVQRWWSRGGTQRRLLRNNSAYNTVQAFKRSTCDPLLVKQASVRDGFRAFSELAILGPCPKYRIYFKYNKFSLCSELPGWLKNSSAWYFEFSQSILMRARLHMFLDRRLFHLISADESCAIYLISPFHLVGGDILVQNIYRRHAPRNMIT